MSLNKNIELKNLAKTFCRDLRKKQTAAEKIFWEEVRNRKFFNKKFYRQYPLFFDFEGKETFFIADFCCFEEQTVIEIDGKIHDYQKDHDLKRSFIINCMGLNVIRFTNDQIEKNINSVLKELKEKMK